jgi:hypothetical protein
LGDGWDFDADGFSVGEDDGLSLWWWEVDGAGFAIWSDDGD